MKAAEYQPETISIMVFGGVYYKVWYVRDAGTVIPQHAHEYDHITALLSGVVAVSYDGSDPVEYKAPAALAIDAGVKHTFTTLHAHTVLACIHNADRLDDEGEPAVREEHQLEVED